MRRKALLSVLLSVVMILGSASPAFAAGQMPTSEVSADMEASVPESQVEIETEYAGQDDSNVNSDQESANAQEVDEEGAAETDANVKHFFTPLGKEFFLYTVSTFLHCSVMRFLHR